MHEPHWHVYTPVGARVHEAHADFLNKETGTFEAERLKLRFSECANIDYSALASIDAEALANYR